MDSEQYEQLDVLIVGAGISGLGMCYNLKNKRAHTSFAVVESRENIGGTWDLFKYPGIRSDSDMYTFAYSFKPWTDQEYIGSADRILNYLQELVRDEGLNQYIRFQQKVISANWDSSQNRWLVSVTRQDGSEYKIAAKFLSSCSGYYNYEQGYLPDFKGKDDFKGQVIHPQHWPEELDYTGKRVIVIGSGATAVTVVPAMAKRAAHVTMLQRSPTYIYPRKAKDKLFQVLSRILPSGIANRIMRFKYMTLQQLVYVMSTKYPEYARKMIRNMNKNALAGAADVDEHFKPHYKPWEQRVALVPDADLYNAIRSGKASVVTEHIDRFTEKGILLKSGQELEADIIVPATGLQMQTLGKMNLSVDGHAVDAKKLVNYKGMMFSQVPNFVWIFGYVNASWTLKAELTFDYVCRLLEHMDKGGHKSVYPYCGNDVKKESLLNLQSGYIERAQGQLPSSGDSYPWGNKEIYFKDAIAVKYQKLDDGVLRFDDNSCLSEFHRPSGEEKSEALTNVDELDMAAGSEEKGSLSDANENIQSVA